MATNPLTAVQSHDGTENDPDIFTFPDLIYKEFLAALLAIAILCIWSMAVDAPLKEIADPNWTENPAKAPWYFVGLQEVLVYFDPWIAGVGIPFTIILGLMILPYVDPNPAGSGGYLLKHRPFAVSIFLAGYVFWFGLILIGQFLRGPSWQFYWPWEDWAIPKSAEPPLWQLPVILGAAALLLYFCGGLLLSVRFARKHYKPGERTRFVIAAFFILLMFSVAGKILLRLVFDIKYVLATPDFSI